MTTYKLLENTMNGEKTICVLKDGIYVIPFDPNNTDYQRYLKWLAGYEEINGEWVKTSEGNTPEPADEV